MVDLTKRVINLLEGRIRRYRNGQKKELKSHLPLSRSQETVSLKGIN